MGWTDSATVNYLWGHPRQLVYLEVLISTLQMFARFSTKKFEPHQIWNIAETTVHKPPKILAPKSWKRHVCLRSTLVTACCAISAGGKFIPPFSVFLRVNFKDCHGRLITRLFYVHFFKIYILVSKYSISEALATKLFHVTLRQSLQYLQKV